jgi:hypothetical protein
LGALLWELVPVVPPSPVPIEDFAVGWYPRLRVLSPAAAHTFKLCHQLTPLSFAVGLHHRDPLLDAKIRRQMPRSVLGPELHRRPRVPKLRCRPLPCSCAPTCMRQLVEVGWWRGAVAATLGAGASEDGPKDGGHDEGTAGAVNSKNSPHFRDGVGYGVNCWNGLMVPHLETLPLPKHGEILLPTPKSSSHLGSHPNSCSHWQGQGRHRHGA